MENVKCGMLHGDRSNWDILHGTGPMRSLGVNKVKLGHFAWKHVEWGILHGAGPMGPSARKPIKWGILHGCRSDGAFCMDTVQMGAFCNAPGEQVRSL
jgi:hypothetical protein